MLCADSTPEGTRSHSLRSHLTNRETFPLRLTNHEIFPQRRPRMSGFIVDLTQGQT